MANVINGTNQDDTLFGTDEADIISGLAGDDTIYASFGIDFEDGGDGIDTFVINAPLGLPYVTVIDLSVGKAYEFGESPEEALASVVNFENVTVISPSNFVLIGDQGTNELIGGDGDDVIKAGDGADVIHAGAGNDIVYASGGADHEDGGDGIDTLIVEDELDYVPMIDLELETAYLLGGQPGTQNSIRNFENVTIISSGAFGIKGDANANILTADKGDDTVIGGAGNDTLNGGDGNDYIEGGAGDDELFGGAGADRFIYNGSLSESLGNDVIYDFNISEGDRLSGVDENGVPHTLDELDLKIKSSDSGHAVLESTLGTVTVVGLSVQELADYVGLERGLTEAQIEELIVQVDSVIDPLADTFIVQRGIVGKGSGYDKYILSNWMVDADAEITITDSGDNALQFINGFEVSSSMVAANAMLLTLSNGAVITVLDAASYDYTVGGNPLENEAGVAFTYQAFVENVLGVEMPTGSQISHGDAVTITSDMTFGNDVIVTSGSAVSGTDAADEFQLDVSNGGVFEIISFDTTEDSLALSGIASTDNDILSELVGDVGVGGQAVTVQYDPFAQETFINLGLDADGEVVALTLVGITQDDWSSVALV